MGYDDGTAGRYGMIENIDDNFGQLMNKLVEWDALENTLVIFTTDNGATHLKGALNNEKITHFNANLKGGKNSPYEGGNHVPFFCYWKGVLQEGKDIAQLCAHIDLYPTFVELAGVSLPTKMQHLDGKSLVPLFEGKTKKWKDRELFVHCGRWKTGEVEKFKYTKYAVRSQDWRYVNSRELYNVSKDPSETINLVDKYPKIALKFKKLYDAWWETAVPLMVNENLPSIPIDEHPLAVRYKKQLLEKGIPKWVPSVQLDASKIENIKY